MSEHEDQADGLDPLAAEVSVLSDLLDRENRGDATVMRVGPWTAYLVVQACQGAVARSQNQTETQTWRALATQFEDTLSSTAAGAMLAAGWVELHERGHQW